MKKVVDTVVECSGLPLSIIIIGIGYSNFEKMKVLDGSESLTHSNGTKCSRDLI